MLYICAGREKRYIYIFQDLSRLKKSKIKMLYGGLSGKHQQLVRS